MKFLKEIVMSENKNIFCSFCGKNKHDTNILIARIISIIGGAKISLVHINWVFDAKL